MTATATLDVPVPVDMFTARLDAAGVTAREIGPGRWTLIFRDDQPLQRFDVRATEDGLRLTTAPIVDPAALDPVGRDPQVGALRLNGRLPGPCRYCLVRDHNDPSGHALCLRVDFGPAPLPERADRILDGCALLRAAGAVDVEHDVDDRTGNTDTDTDGSTDGDGLMRIRQWCDDAGWPYHERDGRLSVRLEAGNPTASDSAALPGQVSGMSGAFEGSGESGESGGSGGFSKVFLSATADGSVAAKTELGRWTQLPDTSRSAIALLLLGVTGAVAHGRASLDLEGEVTVAGLDAHLVTAATAADLDAMLSAMSVAARLCGRECHLLQSEALSRTYLRLRGGGLVRHDNESNVRRKP